MKLDRETELLLAGLEEIRYPSTITLTDRDLNLGYVEVPAATQLPIENDRTAYAVIFNRLGSPFTEVIISGLVQDVQIVSSQTFICQSYKKKLEPAELSYRFVLSKKARPGEYPWPISLYLRPLP
ncbi:MAG: hypothetical protein M0009_05255 [Deltaproteobacteria bacterium]|nr:hypothetical protein [Deltaproteobacteria bacterium]